MLLPRRGKPAEKQRGANGERRTRRTEVLVTDWIRYVQQNLGPIGLPTECEQEIVTELATHFEDMGTPAAADDPVADWTALRRDIRRAKELSMRDRLQNFWLPGLATGVLAAYLLTFMQKLGMRPIVIFTYNTQIVLYLPWLIALPVVGAMGAYWSRQKGGNPSVRLLTAIFPSLALAVPSCVMMLGTVGAAFFYPGTVERLSFLAAAFPLFVGVWMVAPGAALALGALPFLKVRPQPEGARSDAATA